MRSETKPVTSEDKKLSKKHLKDSIRFNKDHAQEHLKLMKKDEKLLRKRK